MTIATTRKMILAEYLTYDDGTDIRYELVDGELTRVSLGTGEHGDISEFLNDEFKAEIRRLGLDWVAKDMKIGIQSPRGTRWEDDVFVGDLTIVSLTFPDLGLKVLEVLNASR